MTRDYQWPEPSFKQSLIAINQDKFTQNEIEDFFSDKFGYPCFLLPSARAALSAILRYKQINRSHRLYAPLWLSHCVWDVLARYGNPTTTPATDVDVNLCVHKWGYGVQTDLTHSLVINDSVDSVFTDGQDLLQGADFEIISLPKTLGSIAGGLLVTRDPKVSAFIDTLRESSRVALARSQETMKLDAIHGTPALYSWEEHDWHNFICLKHTLNSVSHCLSYYQKISTQTSARLARVNEVIDLSYLNLSSHRLPCLVPIRSTRQFNKATSLLTRKFNFSLHNELDHFEDALLLPIHVGISEEEFAFFLNEIKQ